MGNMYKKYGVVEDLPNQDFLFLDVSKQI